MINPNEQLLADFKSRNFGLDVVEPNDSYKPSIRNCYIVFSIFEGNVVNHDIRRRDKQTAVIQALIYCPKNKSGATINNKASEVLSSYNPNFKIVGSDFTAVITNRRNKVGIATETHITKKVQIFLDVYSDR